MAAPGSSDIQKMSSTWGTPEGHQQIAKIFQTKAQVDASSFEKI
jgi:hypothetical protein